MMIHGSESEIRIYCTTNGQEPFSRGFKNLGDIRGRQVIQARLARVRLGNFGNCKSVGQGVFELKINFGPGYRIYFGKDGERIVVLLCIGDKSTQNEDIKKAKEYWKDYKSREKHAKRRL